VQLTATAGLGFLLAVLWFDLMFDVQVRGRRGTATPDAAIDSIAAYYRRVTTNARPMNRLIALVMLVTLGALVGEIAQDDVHAAVAWASLVLAATGIGLAGARTVRNAQRLGSQGDDRGEQARLARRILGDHLLCLAVIATALVVQVGFA
jgi:hypothetical protein